MPAKKTAPEFTRVDQFIRRYSILPTNADHVIAAVWAIGTHTFSPAAPFRPIAYPYLYLTGGKGSGKTQLGHEVFQWICRNHKGIAMTTGPTLFRMIGAWDEDENTVHANYPCLAIDEVDAAFSGSANESLRGVINLGYKSTGTVDRSSGKGTIAYPVYCPKVLMGIENGHLPDTVLSRSIRIACRQATPEQMKGLERLYFYRVEDESAEIQQMLSDWAKREAMVLREYDPIEVPDLDPRQWEIARAIVQIGRALGIEKLVRESLHEVMTRKPEKQSGKEALYRSVWELFETTGLDRVTSRQIMQQIKTDGVVVPGNSMKGLSDVLRADGVQPRPLRLPEGHPGVLLEAARERKSNGDGRVQRGYMRYSFDDMFVEHLFDDDE